MDSEKSKGDSGTTQHIQDPLDSIFEHPEGLRTARNLVQAVYSNWMSHSSQPPDANNPGTSPEVEGILKDILAFSSLHDQSSLMHPNVERNRRDAMTIPHQSINSSGASGMCPC